MSPSFKVEGSTSFTSTRSPAAKSVFDIESESTMKALYPNRLRSERSKVFTETTVNTIIQTANATINQYTVTFNANGHGTAPGSQTVNYGDKATQPAALTETGLYKKLITNKCKIVQINLDGMDLGKSFERVYRGPNYPLKNFQNSLPSKLDNTIDWSLCDGKHCINNRKGI